MASDVAWRTAGLNVLDELYLHLDREDEPWSVHLEVRLEGRVDAERLEAAARAAALRHPMARARLADWRPIDLRHRWAIAPELEHVELEEVGCTAPADLADARERLLSRSLPLDRPGPFALLLAHTAQGDVVALNLHHAAGDGLAAMRLMRSIARAYGGEDDPVPPIDPLEARDLTALAGAGSLRERLSRARAALDFLTRGVSAPARIVPRGATDRPGYGFELLELEGGEVEALTALRAGGATINDVLLGALAVSVRRWNDDHGAPGGTAYLMMPVNLRPPEWRYEVLGNFASYVSVRIAAGDQAGLSAAIRAAAAGTRRIKAGGLAGLIVDLFGAPTLLPLALKRRLQDLIPLTGDVVVDTAVLSNLGRITEAPVFGDAGIARQVWFSPPGRMPLGASLGVATLDGRMFVTLRHRHAQFDGAAARAFLETLRGVLGD